MPRLAQHVVGAVLVVTAVGCACGTVAWTSSSSSMCKLITDVRRADPGHALVAAAAAAAAAVVVAVLFVGIVFVVVASAIDRN